MCVTVKASSGISYKLKKRSESELLVWIRYEFEGEIQTGVSIKDPTPAKDCEEYQSSGLICCLCWTLHNFTSCEKGGLCRISSGTFSASASLARRKTADKLSWWDTVMLFNYVRNSCKLINSWMSWIITRHASFWTFGHSCIDADLGSSHPGPACKYLILPCLKPS